MSNFLKVISSQPAAIQCAFWCLISNVLLVFQLAVVRLIADEINVFEIVFFRSLFSLIFVVPLLTKNARVLLHPNRLGIMILCGALAFVANVCFYFAAKYLPLADITAIHFTRPIFAAILAALILKETLKGARFIAICAGCIGAAIIIRPGIVELNIGILFVFGVVAAQTWNPINRRLLALSEHPDALAVWNPLCIIPLALLPTIFVWTTPSMELLAWMALIGALEMLNQRVLARAYIHGEAVVVLALHYTRLPIAAVLGFFMFGDVPEIWIWVGGGVIIAGSFFLAYKEAKSEKTRTTNATQ